MPAARMKLSAAAVVFSGILALTAGAQAGHGNGGGQGNAGGHGGFGGNSASHISAQGLANSNGPNAEERLFGHDRAEFRHSMHSNIHRAAHHRLAKHSNLQTTSLHGTPNGGKSSSHISAQGLANTDGPNAKTRLFGRERATVRANDDNHIPD